MKRRTKTEWRKVQSARRTVSLLLVTQNPPLPWRRVLLSPAPPQPPVILPLVLSPMRWFQGKPLHQVESLQGVPLGLVESIRLVPLGLVESIRLVSLGLVESIRLVPLDQVG